MTAIQLVIFDCDGVLIDSEIVAAAAELEVYSEFGVEMEPLEYSKQFAGLDSYSIKMRMEEHSGTKFPDSIIKKIRDRVDKKVGTEAKLIADADMILDRMDQARCICSNSPPARLKQSLSRIGLYDRFRPYVFSAEDTNPPIFKPSPEIFEKAMQTFEALPAQTVVVEDSVHGIQGAVASGARVIGFTGASHTWIGHNEQLQDAGAEVVINRLKDLPAMIEAFADWEGF